MIIEDFITGSAVALVAAIIGWFLNRNSAKKAVDLAFNKSVDLIKQYEFIKAGSKFKEAFSGAFEIINESRLTTLPISALWNEIPTQRTAFKEFIVHLPENRRDAFRKAWKDYQREDRDDFMLEYTVVEPVQEENLTAKRKLIIDNIEKLFDFAKP